MQTSLIKKITWINLLSFFIAFSCIGTLLFYQFEQHLRDQEKTWLEEQAVLWAAVIESDQSLPHSSVELQEKIQTFVPSLQGKKIVVLDPTGKLLAQSLFSGSSIQDDFRGGHLAEFEQALKGQTVALLQRGYEGRASRWMVWTPLLREEKSLGVVILYVPSGFFFDPSRLALLFAVAGILGGLLISIFGFLIGVRWKRRIDHITQLAAHQGVINSKDILRTKNDDELDILSKLILHMVKSFRRKIADSDREKEKFLAIFENMEEGVIAVDSHRRIQMMNVSGARILGIDSKQALHKSLIEATRSNQVDEMMEQAMAGAKSITHEIEFSRADHQFLRMSASGIADGKDEVSGILVFYDVTERKKLENIRRDFVANVSHELRTPLTSLKGFIETLLGGASPNAEQSRSFLKMMQEDTDRLTRLIDDLLELSKIESRELPFHPKSVLLKEELEQLVASFEPLLKTKQLKTEIIFKAPENTRVWADLDKLKQVLVNLTDNAIKFNSPNGKISFKVGLLEAQGKVQVSVEDTGAGIPKESLKRIFERFFRLDKARSRHLGGTGLGLSITKHILERHGEKIWCESEVGKGSRFIFTLSVIPSS